MKQNIYFIYFSACKNHSLFSLGNILTIQKQSEELADQECYLSLINENFPVICGRYLTNPVAITLNEGDDMVNKKHF